MLGIYEKYSTITPKSAKRASRNVRSDQEEEKMKEEEQQSLKNTLNLEQIIVTEKSMTNKLRLNQEQDSDEEDSDEKENYKQNSDSDEEQKNGKFKLMIFLIY